jgi:hypothetical protein
MQTETGVNEGISVNVGLIVVVDEVVAERLTEDDPN